MIHELLIIICAYVYALALKLKKLAMYVCGTFKTNLNFSCCTFHLFNHYSNMVDDLMTCFLHVNNLNNKYIDNDLRNIR